MLNDPRIWGTHLKRREVVMLQNLFMTMDPSGAVHFLSLKTGMVI